MTVLQRSVRIALALSVLSLASPTTFAAGPYAVTPLAGTAEALSPTGQVAYVTQSVTPNLLNDGSFYGPLDNYTFTYTLSAPSAGGAARALGTSSQLFSSWYNEFVDGYQPWWQGTAPAATANLFTNAGADHFQVVGVNSSGALAANSGVLFGNFGADGNTRETDFSAAINYLETGKVGSGTGMVANSNGTLTNLGYGTYVTGINASGAVAYSNSPHYSSDSAHSYVIAGQISYLAANSTTPVALADLGYGGTSTGLNDSGQLTGRMYTNAQTTCPLIWSPHMVCTSGNTRAFRTGANGSGATVFGTGPGVSSFGNAINNAGQVGGYVTLASGQTEAFLTTAHGGLLVGLGVGAASDSTQVDFLNNLGQAIVDDTTSGVWYFYSAGVMVPVTSLGAAANDPVVGFNDAGQILFQDPQLYTPTESDWGLASNLEQVSGALDITGTAAYASFVAAQANLVPDSGFFTDPVHSTDAVNTQHIAGVGDPSNLQPVVQTPADFVPPTGSVPEPASLGLLGLGAGVAALCRRRAAQPA